MMNEETTGQDGHKANLESSDRFSVAPECGIFGRGWQDGDFSDWHVAPLKEHNELPARSRQYREWRLTEGLRHYGIAAVALHPASAIEVGRWKALVGAASGAVLEREHDRVAGEFGVVDGGLVGHVFDHDREDCEHPQDVPADPAGGPRRGRCDRLASLCHCPVLIRNMSITGDDCVTCGPAHRPDRTTRRTFAESPP